ncbi:MAG: hypothetical protein ABI624_16955 [Casimicrobiaceae bacterium]
MQTRRALAIAAAIGCVVALGVYASSYREDRAQRNASERQRLLLQAIRDRDADTVEKLVQRPVNIYATDTSGDSALSLAEKSSDRRILDALSPYRDKATDMARALNAVDTGRSVGLQPPPREPELNILALVQEEAENARAEQRPPLPPAAMADVIERKIDALPAGKAKEWALRNFAYHLAERALLPQAQDTALRIVDSRMRAETLVRLAQYARHGDEADKAFGLARREIDGNQEASVRDPLYAELAHFELLRGRSELSRDTCSAIQSPEYLNGSCRPGRADDRETAHAQREATSEQALVAPPAASHGAGSDNRPPQRSPSRLAN